MAKYELVTDGNGECFLHDPVSPGERVELSIVYRGVGDEGVPIGIKDSYPLAIWYNLVEITNDRMRRKIFDYETANLAVQDGIVKVAFTVPENVLVLTVKFLCSMTGGSLFREAADLDWATNHGAGSDRTQRIQAKMLVRVADTQD